MKLVKKLAFEAAHRISTHKGKCRNLHGHQWMVEIEIEVVPFTGDMLIDFGYLKDLVNEFDHSILIYEKDAVLIKIAEDLMREGMKVHLLKFESTAENISRMLKERVSTLLLKSGDFTYCDKCEVIIRLWESPNSMIEV